MDYLIFKLCFFLLARLVRLTDGFGVYYAAILGRYENYGINDLMHPVPLNWRHSQPVVQTPRYYKPTTLKKRPSRLCLPVACKLDPTYRTSCSRKKPSSCDVSMLDKDWQRDNSLRRSTSVELEAVSSDLDSLLVKYETMFDSRSNTNSWTTPKSPDYTDASIAPPLPRPRIHTTIRDKQMRRLPSSSPNSLCNQSELADKGESPSESSHLEGMLNDLVNKGFLPSITEEQTRSLQDMYSQLHDETAQA
uniref:Uncharacterized protein n=1 Tax=Timema bartmani TaxID=61472 RepID=A0A7R9EYN9_9NEOP|nr:unnamed protein product [Timema bartmani]